MRELRGDKVGGRPLIPSTSICRRLKHAGRNSAPEQIDRQKDAMRKKSKGRKTKAKSPTFGGADNDGGGQPQQQREQQGCGQEQTIMSFF